MDRAGDALVVGVSGELDIATAPVLSSAVAEALGVDTASHLILDLLEVTFLDSSGVGALVAIQKDNPDLDVALVIGGGIVAKVVEITGLSRWFRIEDSVEAALPQT